MLQIRKKRERRKPACNCESLSFDMHSINARSGSSGGGCEYEKGRASGSGCDHGGRVSRRVEAMKAIKVHARCVNKEEDDKKKQEEGKTSQKGNVAEVSGYPSRRIKPKKVKVQNSDADADMPAFRFFCTRVLCSMLLQCCFVSGKTRWIWRALLRGRGHRIALFRNGRWLSDDGRVLLIPAKAVHAIHAVHAHTVHVHTVHAVHRTHA
jgi:hypothetical protein